jgi:hypothetical protein
MSSEQTLILSQEREEDIEEIKEKKEEIKEKKEEKREKKEEKKDNRNLASVEIRMPANLKAYKRILLSKLGAAFPQIESGTMNTFNESNPDLFQEIKGNCLNK